MKNISLNMKNVIALLSVLLAMLNSAVLADTLDLKNGGVPVDVSKYEFDCKFNFANCDYNGMSEEEMISHNNLKFGISVWADRWEEMKMKLMGVFFDSFNHLGQEYNLVAGSFEDSPYKLHINVVKLDPDGEVTAHVLAFRCDSLGSNIEVFVDESFSHGGDKDAIYTNLSTNGFRKLGSKLAWSLSRVSDKEIRLAEREARKVAKEVRKAEKEARFAEREARKAEMAASEAERLLASRAATIARIRITTNVEDVKLASLVCPFEAKKAIKEDVATTREEIYQELKEKASAVQSDIVLILDSSVENGVLYIKGNVYRK